MSAKRLCVFGASGRTGLAVVEAAVRRGHLVRALCRPGTEASFPPGVEIVHRSLEEAMRPAVEGADSVLVLFGPRPPHRDVFCRAATGRVLAGMAETGVRRLVCQTGAMVGALPDNVSRPMRLVAALFARQRPQVAADRRGQEDVVGASASDWTLVKPPRISGGGEAGNVEIGPAVRVGLTSRIALGDLARVLLDLAEADAFLRQAVFLRTCR